MFGWLVARLDPDGRALADELERAVGRLGWAQAGWLIEHERHRFTPDEHDGRVVTLRSIWDMDPWASDTYMWLRVQTMVAGRVLPPRLAHSALAQHWGEELPDQPPPSEPVDLAALVR